MPTFQFANQNLNGQQYQRFSFVKNFSEKETEMFTNHWGKVRTNKGSHYHFISTDNVTDHRRIFKHKTLLAKRKFAKHRVDKRFWKNNSNVPRLLDNCVGGERGNSTSVSCKPVVHVSSANGKGWTSADPD